MCVCTPVQSDDPPVSLSRFEASAVVAGGAGAAIT